MNEPVRGTHADQNYLGQPTQRALFRAGAGSVAMLAQTCTASRGSTPSGWPISRARVALRALIRDRFSVSLCDG